ncbi:MAG TPA: aldo/keto reductase [Polyangiaceae bacterium]
MLPRRRLGRTDIEVSRLGLGGLFVSKFGGDRAGSIQAIQRALDLGINYIDTAPTYGDSEEVLGEALAGTGRQLVLSTKIGGRPEPFLARDRSCLLAGIKGSLQRLRRDRVDILMIHEPDRPGQYDWWDDLVTPRGPVLDLLQELKRDGMVRAIGIGGTTAYQLARLVDTGLFDVVLTAFQFSLLWREAEVALIPAARNTGTGLIIGSPLQQGALARRWDDPVRAGAPWLSPPRRAQFLELYQLLDDIGMPLPELALRFALSHSTVDCVLTGARSPREVELNVAAALAGPLSDELLERLQRIADMVPFRPDSEPFFLPFGREWSGLGAAM